MEGRDPYDDYQAINKELASHNLRLLERPQIIVANKMDMPNAEENLKKFKAALKKDKKDEFADDIPVFAISAITKQGLDNLLNAAADLLEVTPEFLLYDEEVEEETVNYGFQSDEPEFTITREPDATWVLTGDKLEKLFKMTNFDHDETVMRFARQLRSMGVDEALRARGAKDGDLVRIDKFEFEFVD
jgi:GTP-binding protein